MAKKEKSEHPYIIVKKRVVIVEVRKYNPKYGDNRTCQCGHSYGRHFDPYEDDVACGCKYCSCGHGHTRKDQGFVERKEGDTSPEWTR